MALGATQGDGPSPLRGPEAPDIYGLPGLSPDDKEKVRLGTACALRALAMAMILHEAGKPWWIETPMPRDGHPSVFKLPEYIDFFDKAGINIQVTAQCNYGSDFKKMTAFASNIALGLKAQCWHPLREWTIPWSGEVHALPHPPLVGKQKAILSCYWSPKMLREREPPGPWITKQAAIYPYRLNEHLTSKVIYAALNVQTMPTHGCRNPKRPMEATSTIDEARSRFRNKDGLPEVTFKTPLRGHKRAKFNGVPGQPIGGLRDVG